ncbi:unnamed protein product [Cochlearia groenlandica]
MEAFTFMKLWLTNTTIKPRRETRISESAVEFSTALQDPDVDLNEGDDSFFELEISLSDFSTNPKDREDKNTTTFSVSKSKIIPFFDNVTSKSDQKSRPFSFNKSTTSTTTTSFRKTACIASSRLKNGTMFVDDSVSSSSSSKRFFDLIKPLYTKSTKKQSINSLYSSPSSSPRDNKQRNTIRSVKRQLGKSRSASAAVGKMSPANRVDETLQLQQDGIQSAILHCKKSFCGSRETDVFSRSTSESSSHEKLSISSFEDSYLFSRIGSDSMSEKSIDGLSSINKEEREKISDYVF